jgi:hypothetical protein
VSGDHVTTRCKVYLDGQSIGAMTVTYRPGGTPEEVRLGPVLYASPKTAAEVARRYPPAPHVSPRFVDGRAARLARETHLSYSEAAGLLDAMPPGTSVEDAARVAVAAHGLGVSPRSLAKPPRFPANDAAARQALASFVDSTKADRRRARNRRKANRKSRAEGGR